MDRVNKAKKIVIPAAIAVALIGGATLMASSSCSSKVETSATGGNGGNGGQGGSSNGGSIA